MKIKVFLNSIRWLLYNLIIRRVILFISLRYTVKDKAVFFVLKNNTSHRYFLNLCHFLIDQKVEVVIRPSFGFLGHWQTREFIRQLPQVKYSFACSGEPVVISDHELSNRRHKTLSFDYFSYAPRHNNYLVPMSMVDTMYYFVYHQQANVLRENRERNIKVFYAGNRAASYNNPTIRKKFALIDRVTIVEHLKSLNGQHYHSSQRIGEIIAGKSKYDVLALDRGEHPIPPEAFLKVLSQCSFIVVPPGVVMPQTHFIVEGMSVGCIPIVQYRKMFHPALEHLTNCLYFNDEEELAKIINVALNMSYVEVERMRSNVLEYYAAHLTPAAVVANVLNPGIDTIFLNAEAESVALL